MRECQSCGSTDAHHLANGPACVLACEAQRWRVEELSAELEKLKTELQQQIFSEAVMDDMRRHIKQLEEKLATAIRGLEVAAEVYRGVWINELLANLQEPV